MREILTFRHEEKHDTHQEGDESLKGHWKSPGKGRNISVGSIFQPVSNQLADDEKRQGTSNKHSSNSSRSGFRLPHCSIAGNQTKSNSSNDTSNNQLANNITRTLEDGTSTHEKGTIICHVDTTEALTDENGSHGSHETTKDEEGSDSAFHAGGQFKGAHKVGSSQNRPHNSIIISCKGQYYSNLWMSNAYRTR